MSNKKIRLLHVVNRFGVGGAERQQTELIKRLPEEGYHQVVAAMDKQGRFLEEITARDIEVNEFPFTSFYDRNAVRQFRSLARLIKQQGIQLVHCHDFYSSIFGAIAARLVGLKKVITSRYERGDLLSVPQRAVQRLAYCFSAAIITNSEATKRVMMKREYVPERKIRCIYNGTDTVRFAPGRPSTELAKSLGFPDGAPIVGTVADLFPWKGHVTFMRAAKIVHEMRTEVRFLIVGDGPDLDKLQRLAGELNIADVTIFAGPRRDIPDLLALMSVFVLSSLTEGLPNAVIEAMACACPVVATKVGGTPELIDHGENGYLIPSEDPPALAEKALRILDDPELGSKMGADARQKVLDAFSIERVVENMRGLYAELLDPRA